MNENFVADIEQVRQRRNGMFLSTYNQKWGELSLIVDVHELQADGFHRQVPSHSWIIKCSGVYRFRINDGQIFSFQLSEDHPLLWDVCKESTDLYFSNPPKDPFAMLGALYKITEEQTDGWLTLSSFLNYKGRSDQIVTLLQSGSGLLASGPKEILELYAFELEKHGCSPAIIDSWHASESGPENYDDCVYKVLVFDTSYVVAEEFSFKQVEAAG